MARHRLKMKKRDTNDSTSQVNLLCLNCRSLGHVVRDCHVQLGQLFPNQHWNYSADRITLLNGLLANANSKLCSRCEKLDILTMFDGELDWMNPQTPLNIADIASSQHYRNLGPVGTVQFRQDCSLCVGLFGLAPTPWSLKEDVHVLADWTIHRLERLVEVGSQPKHCYDKCLVVDLAPKNGQLSLDEHEGDALAILREGSPVSLTPQLVDPALFNLSLITDYFEACDRHHSLTCTRRPGSQLKNIKLIDTETRRLVPYPHQECDYLALSYVWGSRSPIVISEDKSLSTMPATIEDAITLTNLLGKRYLWVDSLCIDQGNEGEKARQIKLMADIYRGAYATIISLCGTTMDDDLARVSPGRRLAQPQLACNINGKRLVGLMPTLSRQVAYGQWGSRAWTLQEALLSRRNIYFTDHQVYFECNAMQCSESIDVSKSWVHNSPRGVKQVKSDSEGLIYGHGTLRNAVTGIGKPKDPMMAYGVLVGLYSYRSMSDDHDAINAFSAILDHLQEYVFDNGFYYGLPEDDLNWSLLWCPLEDIERRPGFPAWSWAGWKGAIHPGWPSEVSGPTQQYWTHFCAWRPNGHRQELVFPHHASDSPQHCQRLFEVATVFDVAVKPSLDPKLLRTYGPCKSNSGVLFIDCLVWQKKFKLRKRYEDWDYGPFEHFVVKLNGVTCLFRAPTSTDLDRHTGAGKQTNLILIARDEWQGYIVHHFLDVDINKKGEAFRHGVLELMVPKSHPEALNGIVVSRRSLVLV